MVLKNQQPLLKHISDEIDFILKYTKNIDLTEFLFKICPEYKEDYAKQSLKFLKKELNIIE